MKDAILAGRKLGKITSLQGQITQQEYYTMAEIQKNIRNIALDFLPHNSIVLEEAIMDTEDLDQNGKLIGIPRANIISLKDLSRRAKLFLIFISSSEDSRRSSLQFRENALKCGIEGIKEFQKQNNIIDDREDPYVIYDSYVRTGNVNTGKQQFEDSASLLFRLIKENIIKFEGSIPLGDVFEFSSFLDKNQHIYTTLLRDHFYPKIAKLVLGESTNQSVHLQSERLTNIPIYEFKDLINKHNLSKYLLDHAIIDTSLKVKLKETGIL